LPDKRIDFISEGLMLYFSVMFQQGTQRERSEAEEACGDFHAVTDFVLPSSILRKARTWLDSTKLFRFP
jgi:hypothetical protein